jgi:hypothetical protein
MIQLTKQDALARQASQVEHYAAQYGAWVREVVAAATHADALPDEGMIDVIEVNRAVPRGGAIESLICGTIGHDYGRERCERCARCNARKGNDA